MSGRRFGGKEAALARSAVQGEHYAAREGSKIPPRYMDGSFVRLRNGAEAVIRKYTDGYGYELEGHQGRWFPHSALELIKEPEETLEV